VTNWREKDAKGMEGKKVREDNWEKSLLEGDGRGWWVESGK
jgi:hypothetical protein